MMAVPESEFTKIAIQFSEPRPGRNADLRAVKIIRNSKAGSGRGNVLWMLGMGVLNHPRL